MTLKKIIKKKKKDLRKVIKKIFQKRGDTFW